MPVETLRPNAPGTYTQVPSQIPDSGAHWDKVDEAVVDYNTTVVFSKQVTDPFLPPELPDNPP